MTGGRARRWLWLVFLGLAAAACALTRDGSALTPTSEQTVFVPAVQAAATPAPPIIQDELVSVPSLVGALTGLNSYRLAMVAAFNGRPADDLPGVWQLGAQLVATASPAARRLDLDVGGALGLQALSVAEFESESFLSLPGIGCVAGGRGDFVASFSGPGTPEAFVGPIQGARLVSEDELVGEVPVRHYQFDEAALTHWRDQPLTIDGHLFLAREANTLVRLTLEATGEGDLLGQNVSQEGTLQLTVDVQHANQPLVVERPAGCGASDAYPLPPGAYRVTVLEDLVGYRAPGTVAELVAFYEAEMPLAGWSAGLEPLILEDTALLFYSRNGQAITINIDTEAAEGAVSVIISSE